MKKIFIILPIVLLGLVACNQVSQNTPTDKNAIVPMFEEVLADDIIDGNSLTRDVSEETLSEEEKNSLIFMREEEKLARDVYLELYKKWGQKVFKNIAESEATHTAAVKTLLDRYEITDPVTSDEVGSFTNPEFTQLFEELTTQGKQSLYDALVVWATIEDLDIKDLQEQSKNIDNADILLVYSNLERGSRNHLRAFTKNITSMGWEYEPQYISRTEYKNIISSAQEKGGRGNGRGGK